MTAPALFVAICQGYCLGLIIAGLAWGFYSWWRRR
jgi:hypothetical protein